MVQGNYFIITCITIISPLLLVLVPGYFLNLFFIHTLTAVFFYDYLFCDRFVLDLCFRTCGYSAAEGMSINYFPFTELRFFPTIFLRPFSKVTSSISAQTSVPSLQQRRSQQNQQREKLFRRNSYSIRKINRVPPHREVAVPSFQAKQCYRNFLACLTFFRFVLSAHEHESVFWRSLNFSGPRCDYSFIQFPSRLGLVQESFSYGDLRHRNPVPMSSGRMKNNLAQFSPSLSAV